MKKLKSILDRLAQKVTGLLDRIKGTGVGSFVFRVIEELGRDNASDMAAGIAYYSVLSIFPLLLGIIAVLGLFLPSQNVQSQIFDFAEQYLPGSIQLIEENVSSVIRLRGALGAISIFGLFWTGSAIFEAIGRVMNTAWGIPKKRNFFNRKIIVLTMAVSTGILFLLSMAVNTLSSIIPNSDIPVIDLFSGILGRIVGIVLIFFIFALLLKIVPNTKTYWRHVLPGALFTTVLFEIARAAFTYYLANFAGYDKVYGSLAAVIILVIWIYFSAFILIIGTEFTSEYSRVRDKVKR